MISDTRDHTNNYAIFKQDEIWRNRNNLDYVGHVCQETTVEDLKALSDMNILMGLNLFPQWHQNDFIGSSGVKKQ